MKEILTAVLCATLGVVGYNYVYNKGYNKGVDECTRMTELAASVAAKRDEEAK